MNRRRVVLQDNWVKFAIVFCVVNLHVLRNISEIAYLAVYVPVAGHVALRYLSLRKRELLADRGNLFLVWVLVALSAFCVSLLVISPSGAVTGLTRFLFATPVFMAFVVYTDDAGDLLKHVRTIVVFFGIASLTLPLQLATGPISWFAEESTRAGLERYSSLVGSLTSVGVAVGSYLILTQMLPTVSRNVWLSLTAIAALTSLSKASVANVALGVCLIAYLNRRSLSRILAFVVVGLLVGFFVVLKVPVVTERLSVPLSGFGVSISNSEVVNYDRSASGSASDRMTSLPLANIEALRDLHSPLVYLVGGGFGMGSTALVPKTDATAPMAHNQFAESLSVFGALGGGIQIYIMGTIARRLYRRRRSDASLLSSVTLMAYGLFLVNSVFANGTIYQPAEASILYLSLFVATSSIVGRESGALVSRVRDDSPVVVKGNDP